MVAISAELKKDVKKYLSDVNKCLYCDRKTKNRLLRDLEENVNSYLSDIPDSDFNGVVEHFGTPESIAEEFAANADTVLLKATKRNKNLKWLLIIILAAIALFIGVIAFIIVKNNSRDAAYYYNETVTDNGIIEETLEG